MHKQFTKEEILKACIEIPCVSRYVSDHLNPAHDQGGLGTWLSRAALHAQLMRRTLQWVIIDSKVFDLFFVISFGKKVFCTHVVQNTFIRHSLNPVWDEKLLFHGDTIGYQARCFHCHFFNACLFPCYA